MPHTAGDKRQRDGDPEAPPHARDQVEVDVVQGRGEDHRADGESAERDQAAARG
jgi:hypothetical protein